jgi:hypothetical protein
MRGGRGAALVALAALVVVVALVTIARHDDDPDSKGTTTRPATASLGDTTQRPTEREQPGTTATGAPEPAPTSTTATPPPPPYALGPTRRCLEAAGFAVAPVRPSDPRLRALRDLAQRTSLQAGRDGRTLGLAFGDAELLASLLEVPNDPYRLEVRRNALLMYRPLAKREAAVLRSCLRS